MRAFVAAGARQKPRQQNWRDQPGECRDLQRRGRAAHRKIDRECRESRQAAEQPRRHEGAMARPHQRVVSCRRMQQRIKTIADNTRKRSRLSRFGLFVKKTRRNAPLSLPHRVRANLSERWRAASPSRTVSARGFRTQRSRPFAADGEYKVSTPRQVWFRNGRRGEHPPVPPGNAASIENLRRFESIDVFDDLTSRQTPAIYRQVLVKDQIARSIATRKRRPGSRDVFSFVWHFGSGWCSCCCPGRDTRIGQAAAGRSLRGRFRCERGGVGHEPILQAAAGGVLRSAARPRP